MDRASLSFSPGVVVDLDTYRAARAFKCRNYKQDILVVPISCRIAELNFAGALHDKR